MAIDKSMQAKGMTQTAEIWFPGIVGWSWPAAQIASGKKTDIPARIARTSTGKTRNFDMARSRIKFAGRLWHFSRHGNGIYNCHKYIFYFLSQIFQFCNVLALQTFFCQIVFMSKDIIENTEQDPEICESGSITPRRLAKMKSVLARRQPDLTLVLSNIHDPHNVSAIYRSCDAFGIKNVHLHYTKTAFPILGRKSSASARKWVDTIRHKNSGEMFAELRKEKFQVLATSFSDTAKSLWEWNFLRPTAIILGNEHEGVEEDLLARADGEIYIPMLGMIQSLNVSVAAAVILAEAARQRMAAGWYDKSRMESEVYRANLENWLQR